MRGLACVRARRAARLGRRCAALLCASAISAASAAGQATVIPPSALGDASALVRSARAARRLVVEGVAAIGGMDALQRLRSLSVERPFRRTTLGQGIRPGQPGRSIGVDLTDADVERGRYRTLRDMEIDGGQMWSAATIVTPAGVTVLNYANHTVFSPPPAAAASWRADILRREVPTLLLSALGRAPTLRLLPDPAPGERAVTYADADGAQVALVFDAKTHLLLRSEAAADDAHWGDMAVVWRYGEYRPIGGGLRLPAVVAREGPGPERFDMRLGRVEVNAAADSVFAVPPSFRQGAPSPAPELAPGVISLGAGVAIAFADHVLVFEAYGDNRRTDASLARIRSLLPGKPIRTLVVSHYHNDHIGGVRNVVAAGASILTVPDAVGPIRSVLARAHELIPDSLSVHPRSPAIETITDKLVIEDSTRRLELYQVGPTAHVGQILIAYLPRERILIEGDLLDMPSGHPAAGGDDTVQLGQIIERLGLKPEKIVPIHGDPGTMADLEAAIRMHDARAKCPREMIARLSCPYQAAAGR